MQYHLHQTCSPYETSCLPARLHRSLVFGLRLGLRLGPVHVLVLVLVLHDHYVLNPVLTLAVAFAFGVLGDHFASSFFLSLFLVCIS